VLGLAGLGPHASGLQAAVGSQLGRESTSLVRFLPVDLLYLVGLGLVASVLAEVYCRYVLCMQRWGYLWFGNRFVLRMVLSGAVLETVYDCLPFDFRSQAALQRAAATGHVGIAMAMALAIFVLLVRQHLKMAAAPGAPEGLFAPIPILDGSIGLACGG